MSDLLQHFVQTCRTINPAAASAGYPPFTAAFRNETPFNSAPYLFDMPGFRDAFATNPRRRAIVADGEAALAALERGGIFWHALLVGGSFIRSGAAPSDLDGLVIYSLTVDGAGGSDATLRAIPRILQDHPLVDFKFCPIDVDPIILVKRLLFFANVFAYDKRDQNLSRGSVMIVPDGSGADDSGRDACQM